MSNNISGSKFENELIFLKLNLEILSRLASKLIYPSLLSCLSSISFKFLGIEIFKFGLNSSKDLFPLLNNIVVRFLSRLIFFSSVQNFELGFNEQLVRNKN